MGSLLATEKTPISEILENAVPQTIPSGDILYTSFNHPVSPNPELRHTPFRLLVSPDALTLLQSGLLDLLDSPQKPDKGKDIFGGRRFSFVTKEKLDIDSQRLVLALKRFNPNYLINGLKDIDQFYIIRTLQSLGFSCITPLVATRDRFISRWAEGDDASDGAYNRKLKDKAYLDLLQKETNTLKRQGLWDKDWKIDIYADNYIPNENNKPADIRKRYIIIDPIFIPPYLSGW